MENKRAKIDNSGNSFEKKSKVTKIAKSGKNCEKQENVVKSRQKVLKMGKYGSVQECSHSSLFQMVPKCSEKWPKLDKETKAV